ncbi:hypothetical protein ACL6C3_16645 [Capilliphycus salinus ALCB114379]|uniref:hypothetical protein n=1 Tax=Capilliphycus salinus TaxID=2768948 RepID=UPI0039A64133
MVEIYIRSRGFEQNNGYCWLQLTDTGEERVDGLPTQFEDESIHLIYSESPSVVLSRKQGLLLLIITAIQPDGRKDFSARTIRISVAFIAEDSEEIERVFRMLAANALDEEDNPKLTEKIAQAVTLGGENGFQGNFQELLGLVDSQNTEERIQNQPLSPEQTLNKLAKISPDMKRLLAEELREYCLPKTEGVLVVSTGIKKEETFRNARVWRGLSSLVKSEDQWWIYYPIPDFYPFPEPEGFWESLDFKFKIRLFKFLLGITNFWEAWLIDLIESKVNLKAQDRR